MHRYIVLLIVLVAACAPQSPTKAPHAAAKEPPLSAYVLPDAQYVLHLRSAALRELGIRKTLEQAAATLAPDAVAPLADIGKQCGIGWESVDELMLSGRLEDDDLLGVATVRDPTAMLQCLKKGAELKDDNVAVVRGTRLFVGSRKRVAEAVKHPPNRAGAQDVITRLEGDDESLCRLYVVTPPNSEARAVSLALGADEGELTITASIDLPSTEAADRLANMLRGVIEGARGYTRASTHAVEAQRLARLLRHIEVSRRVGARVTVDLDVVGGTDRQIQAFEGFIGFSRTTASIIRRQNSAQVARTNVVALAQRIAAHAEANRRGFYKLPTLPDAAPPTPAQLPSEGMDTSATDWSHPTWRALSFVIEGRVDHRYAVELSRDRRTATVHATADLDGDGVSSHLELAVRISMQGKVTIDDQVTASDELE
ncbi:MAG TPA: hypothetical protein VFB62_00085 [Polyangiaceae bacterium]|jgi:hypothetical protein|nr:hypothetical protein [Polyangiaceae bacterium]